MDNLSAILRRWDWCLLALGGYWRPPKWKHCSLTESSGGSLKGWFHWECKDELGGSSSTEGLDSSSRGGYEKEETAGKTWGHWKASPSWPWHFQFEAKLMVSLIERKFRRDPLSIPPVSSPSLYFPTSPHSLRPSWTPPAPATCSPSRSALFWQKQLFPFFQQPGFMTLGKITSLNFHVAF